MKITNEIIAQKAKSIGFDLVGFAKADELKEEINRLEEWLAKGYQAEMSYMGNNVDKRKDVSNILQNAKSVISLGLNYYHNIKFSNNPGTGKVSRYAWGKDYHLVIWGKLSRLESELKEIDNNFESKSYVDTGPVMDKVWAVKSGLGWMGKHTNLINKEFGSWFFIATIITNFEFDYAIPIPDFCGTCTACIDACPTGAIVNPYIVDSNKCISFLTIENKNEISDEFKGKFNNWIFGCDICQDVCPWNIKFSQETSSEDFNHPENMELNLNEVLEISEEGFKSKFFNSPVKRTKLLGLKRNAKFLLQ
ncbi:MAG: tRNA epoxyqueuosine(34) reductase QueG [Ignavibacteriaceae bacterium]